MQTGSERRSLVLAALKLAGSAGISGEVLANALGVSRVAVAKHIAALRALGYEIDAVHATGYRLVSVPDLPLPDEVAPKVRSTIWRLRGGLSTGSTNDDIKALGRAGEPEGAVVLAAEQTSGRGRLGRSWESPQGGLYLSALLRPPVAPIEVPPLALAIGVGVANGLESLGARPLLKWPNDILLPMPDGEPGKLVGILLEMSAEADGVEWVAVGCGINVHAPAEPRPGAAYLDDALGRRCSVPEVAAAVLDGIADAYAAFLGVNESASGDGDRKAARTRFAALADEYRERDALRGKDVTVRDSSGRILASGRASGIDDDGRLVLHNGTEETVVAAGEVTLRG